MFVNKKTELKILNKNSQSLEYPSYNHIVIDEKKISYYKFTKNSKGDI